MTVEPDVKRIARRFGIDPELIQAVVNAEGGGARIIRAVQCSVPSVTTREEAMEITCRSAVHAMCDWVKLNAGPDFVSFWAARWAPEGVQNDPTNLNTNWPHNVIRLWLGVPR